MNEDKKEDRLNLNEVMPDKKEDYPRPEEKTEEIKEDAKPING